MAEADNKNTKSHSTVDSGPCPLTDVHEHYRVLAGKCSAIVDETLRDNDRQALQGTSHVFLDELAIWVDAAQSISVTPLWRSAAFEYQFALLAVSQGQYRSAFKGLRLTLELLLQSLLLSTNELELREWMVGIRDTSWANLTDKECGVFSQRRCLAFCPTLADEAAHFGSIAKKLYRELSQFVHGNMAFEPLLPEKLQFENALFNEFHKQADMVAYVTSYALTVRFVPELERCNFDLLDSHLAARLGHLEVVRDLLSSIRTT